MSEKTAEERKLIVYLDREPEHDCCDVWADQCGGCKCCQDIRAAVQAETERCAGWAAFFVKMAKAGAGELNWGERCRQIERHIRDGDAAIHQNPIPATRQESE